MKQSAALNLRKAWFELQDFAISKGHGVDSFTLMIERKDIKGQPLWLGCFKNGDKKLNITGSLQKA